MSISDKLLSRAGNTCELCADSTTSFFAYTVPPKNHDSINNQVVLCQQCHDAISASDYSNTNHWRCLSGSIWNEVPAVQALSYKILSKLKGEEWATEILDSVALDETVLQWANAEDALEAAKIVHKDAYGNLLESGDSIVLIQNLNVKGTNYIAPKGTIVRKIKVVQDNEEQIEGKVNGDTIVILTKFVKKSV